jgi:hypothetical protein
MSNWREWLIVKPFIDFYHIFDNSDKGFSWRKVAATVALIEAIHVTDNIVDESKKIQGIELLLIFSGICIGLIAIPDLIKAISIVFKGKDGDNISDDKNKC